MEYNSEQMKTWFDRVISKVLYMRESQENVGIIDCPFCDNCVDIRVIGDSYFAKCRTKDCFSSSENWKWK